jgi:putative SOS response-associated peptidase YedK
LCDDNDRHLDFLGRQARARPDALGPDPYWWNKSLEEMKLATFNARAETVPTKPMLHDAFKGKIPASGYYERHDAPDGSSVLFHAA